MKKATLLLCVMLSISLASLAQRLKLEQGSLDALKGTTAINVQYDYKDMKVGKKNEQDYIREKKAEYNNKEAGKGDKWEQDWMADRENRFQKQFEEEFAKQSELQLNGGGAKYTLIFKTTQTEPGYNIAVMRKSANIDGEAWIVDAANPSDVIAKISVDNAPGRDWSGMDYDSGYRIQEAYAKAGKELGKFIRKKTK